MVADWCYLDFLHAASQRIELSSTAKRVFNANGVEINDCMMIEDDDILFLSSGNDFIEPTNVDKDKSNDKDRDRDNIPSIVGGYKVGKVLGKGGFGVVRVGEHHLTGEKVALKFLRKSEIMSIGAAERTTTEIQCLTTLKHQHIIRLQQHFESPQHVVLVFELMEGGDLLKYLLNLEGGPSSSPSSSDIHAVSEDEARPLFHQILSAVSFAHNQHICHRDLKLENILLKTNSLALVKIADFGLSDFYRPGSTMKTSCGTLSFLAPEVFRGTSNAGPPLDVWSLGVILFAILCGRLPFEGTDLSGNKRPRDAIIKSRIMKCSYKIDEYLSLEAKDLVRRMLKLDPVERATLPEIFNHCWMRSMSNPHHDYIASRVNTTRDSFEKVEKRESKDEIIKPILSLNIELEEACVVTAPAPGSIKRSLSVNDRLISSLETKSLDLEEVPTSTSPSCKLVPLRRRTSSRIDDEEEILIKPDTTLRPSTVNEGTRRYINLVGSEKDDIESSDILNKRLSSTTTKRSTILQPLSTTKTGWGEVSSPSIRDRKQSVSADFKNDIFPRSRSGSVVSASSSPRISSRRKVL